MRYLKIALSYDPLQHFPPPAGWSDANRDRELAYTGSPLEERPAFLQRLGEEFGLPVSVAGPRWDGAWSPELRAKYLFGGMMKDAAYREAMWRSKINMSFVTRLNEEDVAHKSFEITGCGQFLLAERSPGHQEAFEEGKEAEFLCLDRGVRGQGAVLPGAPSGAGTDCRRWTGACGALGV